MCMCIKTSDCSPKYMYGYYFPIKYKILKYVQKRPFHIGSLFNDHCFNIIIIILTCHYYNLNFESAIAIVFLSHSMFFYFINHILYLTKMISNKKPS